ncbi:MAG TPA: hypothetical protein VG318_05905 [Actinomycetota bacterium]|nr:hypothetical protein [Actinomycetota bacterium]
MRKISKYLAFSLMVAASLWVASPAGADTTCVGGQNTAGACVTGSSEEVTVGDCFYLGGDSCTDVSYTTTVPSTSFSCSVWVGPPSIALTYRCIHS